MELFSDNGPHFSSREFKNFSNVWDFDHVSSSPDYPQSNGLVERMVQTVQKAMKKTFKQGGDQYLSLLALNTTPGEDGTSPAEKLYGRRLRTDLPSIKPSIAMQPMKPKRGNKEAYDSKAKDLPEIYPGTTV